MKSVLLKMVWTDGVLELNFQNLSVECFKTDENSKIVEILAE